MNDIDIATDRLRGGVEIAEFLGLPIRRAFYLLETGQIPGGKEGRIWIASKRALQNHYRRMTGAE
jgi:hypothetical protein